MKWNNTAGVALATVLTLGSCTPQPSPYESYDTHADGTSRTAAEKADMQAARIRELRRLYGLLGDRSLTPQQIEAIRVSMNVNFCGGLVP